ncbi:hypothetical protein GCM10011514_29120 [Emticicia aquatilis]|uniref:Lipoprotein n=1 Tax=Emticicia aquatilis TaxID=1537369 RepID=A0A916YVR7_9BACT|nr:hypothetical protein [Emticicia aquatilis]GGD63253.1 hypothetical protein GCM10011514_29120 [Emticicia aquatilis]
MTIKNLKLYQTISGVLMLVFFGCYLYLQFVLHYEGIYYSLCKGIYELLLALTFHFSLSYIKLTKPQNYKESLHKMVVLLWSIMGGIHIIEFIAKLF